MSDRKAVKKTNSKQPTNKKPESIKTEATTNKKSNVAEKVAKELNKVFGAGSAMIRGSQDATSEMLNIPFWVKTYIPQLDYAVGGYSHPGFPVGRVIEVYGAEASGKTTLATWLLKVFVDEHGVGMLQDAEHALSEERIEQFELNMEDVIYAQPETMEEVYQQQEAAIDIAKKDNDEPMIIVWDSVASSPTKAELEGEYGDSVMGQHARLMSQGLRKIKGKIKRCNIMAVYINQTREKIGVTFGDKSNTFGGKALKFYATVRIEVTMIGKLKKNDGADPHGIAVRAVVKKNKVAPPFKKAEFEIFFDDTGIDHIGATLDWLKQHELIGGSQGWYEIKGKNYRRDEARDLLYRDEELLKEIRNLAYSVSAPK